MSNLWIHPELRSNSVGFGSLSYAEKMHRAHVAQRRHVSFTQSLLPAFIAACLILIPLCFGLVLFKSNSASTVVMDWVDSAFFPSVRHTIRPVDKATFLAGLSLSEQDELRSKIIYISQLIKVARPEAPAEDLATTIVAESRAAEYDPIFVAAVIMAESRFSKTARSHVGALGLMQILPDTARFISKVTGQDWKGTWTLTNDPSYNIRLGISYLKYLEDEFNLSREHKLMAYNWGPANVVKFLKREKRPPTVTTKYAKQIISLHRDWSAEFEERKPSFKYMAVNYEEPIGQSSFHRAES